MEYKNNCYYISSFVANISHEKQPKCENNL